MKFKVTTDSTQGVYTLSQLKDLIKAIRTGETIHSYKSQHPRDSEFSRGFSPNLYVKVNHETKENGKFQIVRQFFIRKVA